VPHCCRFVRTSEAVAPGGYGGSGEHTVATPEGGTGTKLS
jgi:hypothetical protein